MIPLPSKFKITEEGANFKKFEIDGLYPGYGTTIGNALRRVLLSSLEGAAITKVKIKGADHEFSTLEGVAEDVVNIILNLKQVRFKIFSDEPQQITLKAKGEKEVTSNDFKLTSELELVSKDLPIATLTSKSSELEIEATVEKGVGYEPIERKQKEKLSIGEILLDAIYTPVRKVSLNIDNVRVGDRTDFDRIILGVQTDGTISPEEAFNKSIDILTEFLTFLKQAPVKEAKK
ncbi:MAG TPA: DNA-directed RNA polymerase subunit alpha [Candidatus Pacearchaeota archaeon]|nr:DNA-directed RNA polymerase subunit alpha [Candidatus Parcubacteria bacterium]HNZ83717.1 DNA-directed RNA polymerase subunit alpha [Candidatus Pacearchaeota archaeon]HOU45847.1 DNA-directed RNA polymerase subunit alpha [Candidatus Pacearchaeota archaeon]HPM08367.1 DNA-directed RNA polymerase subunit alpha [Candidatus Pacearchaeota archaeon]HQI74364.1 DNA-directed RNA polymerase subunit alpha [Candidatus Pacearchaeota archaeon]